MAERTYPREWLELLPEESARWVKEGLISAEQRATIAGLYPARPVGQREDRTVMIMSILGSVLVGAGVILFFAANWPKIPAGIKVGAILAAVIGAYGSGYFLQYVLGTYPRLGHALILLGGLFYGAGIWLVAQIFHLESRYPNGFLMWALGLLPVMWATASYPLLYLSTALLGIWTVMEQTEYANFNFLFPVLLLLVVLPLARRLGAVLNEAGVVFGLFLWFAINTVRPEVDRPGGDVAFFTMARVAMLYGVSVVTAGFGGLGDPRAYLGMGSILALFGSYVLTFDLSQNRLVFPHLFAGSAFGVAGAALFLAAAAAGVYQYWRQERAQRIWVAPALLAFMAAAALANFLPEVPRMILFNVLLFSGTVGLVVLGIQRRSELLINVGLLAFVVHMFTRYVDLFFTAMDKSLFFILGGVLLLGGGWLLERNRRRWIGEIGGEGL